MNLLTRFALFSLGVNSVVRRFARLQIHCRVQGAPIDSNMLSPYGPLHSIAYYYLSGLGKRLLEFIDNFIGRPIHVHSPCKVIFLCGGKIRESWKKPRLPKAPPITLREAFLLLHRTTELQKYHVVIAEDVTKETFFAEFYTDLLTFEKNVAELTEVILLFCESPGSLAELGAFTAVDEIKKHLFVVIHHNHFKFDSFIKSGPLKILGRDSYCVLKDGQTKDIYVRKITVQQLQNSLLKPLKLRLESQDESTTFEPHKFGHVVKLIVGLVQYYGALTEEEIREGCERLGVLKTINEVRQCLRCALAVNWLAKNSDGMTDHYLSIATNEAASFDFKKRTKEQLRFDIRQNWKKNDEDRFTKIIAKESRTLD